MNSLKKAEHFLISASNALIKFQDELTKMPPGPQTDARKRFIFENVI
jgi:hypothetical protein